MEGKEKRRAGKRKSRKGKELQVNKEREREKIRNEQGIQGREREK